MSGGLIISSNRDIKATNRGENIAVISLAFKVIQGLTVLQRLVVKQLANISLTKRSTKTYADRIYTEQQRSHIKTYLPDGDAISGAPTCTQRRVSQLLLTDVLRINNNALPTW